VLGLARGTVASLTSLRARRVLVTGGSGFIGGRLATRLARLGVCVTSLGNRKVQTARDGVSRHRLDLADGPSRRSMLAEVRPELIVHLAVAREPEDLDRLLTVNGAVPRLLLEEALDVGASGLIHVGSLSEYGCAPEITEGSPLRPVSRHGATKAAGSLALLQAAAEGSPVTVARCSYVYGPGEKPTRLIPSALRAAREGTALALTEPGVVRDYIHVDDVVEGLLAMLAADLPPGSVANLASGEPTSNEEVVSLVERMTGCQVTRRIGAVPLRPWDVRELRVLRGQVVEQLGWRPRATLEAGVADYLGATR